MKWTALKERRLSNMQDLGFRTLMFGKRTSLAQTIKINDAVTSEDMQRVSN